MNLRLPKLVWDGGGDREIDFPDSWDVNFCPTRGWDRPAMSDDQMRGAFAEPIGAKRIRTLAQGKKEVAVIFDDITRPTPVYRIAPFVLEELREAGIADEHIRFVIASGTHGAHDNKALAREAGSGDPGALLRLPAQPLRELRHASARRPSARPSPSTARS